MTNSTNIVNAILSVLFFPLYFQGHFVGFVWGAADSTIIMLLKRLFLLLPALAFIGACWVTIAAMLTVVFRHNRQQFCVALVITWWDLGKATVAFWGGIFRFIFTFCYGLVGFIKIII